MSKSQQQVILPMLAHPLDGAHRKHLRFPCLTQPKLDGVRMLVISNSMKMYSRTGKPFDHLLPLFAAQLRTLIPSSSFPSSLVLDGELYVHRAGFQKIVSMAKNASDMAAASKELQYWIYDLYDPARPNLPTSARMELLEALFASASADKEKIPKLRLVPVSKCSKEAEIAGILERHEKAGYEGVMLRNGDAPYAPGKRSNGLLKLKSFVDNEFEIVGFEEATGKDKGTVVFVCSVSTSSTDTFRVRPTGTLAERAKMLKDAPDLIGKKLTVRYQELSDDGIPRFPVGIAVRDYE